MTKYREIIRLTGLGFSQRNIMASCGVSQKTVVKVQKRARELNISWPLDESMTDTELQKLMFSKESKVSANKRIPDYAYIRKELLRNGVSKKLLCFFSNTFRDHFHFMQDTGTGIIRLFFVFR